ncbi:MAG TPA: sugar ABC transporter permease [Planctomycetota bacterium]|nr:sugar ABC transporter permease [Planctomycetota bacterium]HRR81353.1 sugar ABC transporter permease [Planctomycetota bacterium]HRT94265.1 sugar ABC transporter permease [Planctomycetota bacterium]
MKATSGHQRDFWPAMGFLMPNLLGFLVFTAGPVLFSLAIAFTNWDLQRTVPFGWIGLRNFAELFGDQQFWLYFLNTVYLMMGLPFAIAGSLLLALLLSQNLRGIVVYRTLFYLPTFTSGVALMILWKALYNPDFGPINAAINAVLGAVGLRNVQAPVWLLSTKNIFGLAVVVAVGLGLLGAGRLLRAFVRVPARAALAGAACAFVLFLVVWPWARGLEVETVGLRREQWGLGARDAIILMGVWIAIGGNNMLLYLAALSNVPQELYEAAQIDGAGRWATFWNVTWPQLAPTTFFIVVMSFIGGLQGGFEQARVMTYGGPAGTTTTLVYHIYTKAFEEFQMGYASAISWVLFTIIFTVTLVNWKFGAKELSY